MSAPAGSNPEMWPTAWSLARWLGRSYWLYRRQHRMARRAVLFAPLGVRLIRWALKPKPQVLLRARIHEGAGMQIRVLEPVTRKKSRRGQ
jgi:hypothetical protein